MALEERTRPYEFLARWSDKGLLAGAHVQMITEVVKDGNVIAATIGDALPVGAAGFPLKDLLGTVQVDAVLAMQAAQADAKASRAAAEVAGQARADAEGARDAALGEISRLQEAATATAVQTAEREERAARRYLALETEAATLREQLAALTPATV